ncbi:MAG TPA: hypothetical protein VIM69_02280 [Opitutaceae bacterium]
MFLLSLASLAGLAFVYGDFSPIIGPLAWPRDWIFVLAAVLIAACAGLLLKRTEVASAIAISLYAIAWAAVRTTPIIQAPLSVGSWYGLSEAAALMVGVWTFYALHCRRDQTSDASALTRALSLRVRRTIFGGACLVWGLAHFAYAEYSLPFVPTWLPARTALVYLTGGCHVAAGVGLIIAVLPGLAAALEALMIVLFGLLVWLPSHLQNPVPKWAGSPQNQWSETILNFFLAAVAWMIADSFYRFKATVERHSRGEKSIH